MTPEQDAQANVALALLADALGIVPMLMAVACRTDEDGDVELRILIHPAGPSSDEISDTIEQAERIIRNGK